MRFRTKIASLFGVVLLVAGTAMPGQATGFFHDTGVSPALCGPGDIPEPGIQGEVPLGATPNYNCGVKLVGQLPGGGAVQGNGTCAYRRNGAGISGGTIDVIDVSDPTNPVVVQSVPWTSPPGGGSETMRAVVASDRAVLVQGKSVYEISDCLHPVFKGDINWPNVKLPLPPPIPQVSLLPHDLRISPDARTVYASFGMWEVDISNLDDPRTWTLTDNRCDLSAQIPGPWKELHKQTIAAGLDLCTDQARPPLFQGPPPNGAGNQLGVSLLHGAVLWPSMSHTIAVRGDGTRTYLGDQAGGTQAAFNAGADDADRRCDAGPAEDPRQGQRSGPRPRLVPELDWPRVRASEQRGRHQGNRGLPRRRHLRALPPDVPVELGLRGDRE